MDTKLFSTVRLRQILNDLKRRPEDAARELKISHAKIKKILNGKANLDFKTVKKIIKVWPVQVDSLINHKFFYKKSPDIKIFTKKQSLKTSRIIKRNGKDYYEYRDTVMEKFAPFRPEWIRTICKVNNNKSTNKNVIWNKGHLLHQFTYFVGNINFYYVNDKGVKSVAKMKTGDSMYISPYVPHSFASRDNLENFIIALTYLDKVTPQLQDNLTLIGNLNAKKILVDVKDGSKINKDLIKRFKNNLLLTDEEISKRLKKIKKNNVYEKYSNILGVNTKDILAFDKRNKVTIKKKNNYNKWYFPNSRQKTFQISELASSKFVPDAKSIEINVLKNNNIVLENFCHQYLYVLSDNIKLKHNSKIFKLNKDDTFYLKPFVKFSIINKNANVLILRVPGNISGDNLLQLSQLGKKNIERVLSENSRWY